MENEVLVGGVSVLLLTVALVQLIKSYISPNAKSIPLLAVAIATTLSLLGYYAQVYAPAQEPVRVVVSGLVVGLSAMGLWSGTRSTLGK